MTIKSKLIANVLLTAVILVALSLAGLFSMRFLQGRLAYLTEKSTPFQIRTIELQRELQRCIATLIKVNAARTMEEYRVSRAEAERALAVVAATQKSLEKMSDDTQDVSNDLAGIALELFSASEERINSNNAAIGANTDVLQLMQVSSARLKDLDTSIRSLQASYSKSFATALEHTGVLSGRLRSIEELRDQVKELQFITVNVQNIRNDSAALIAKGKLKALRGRMLRNDYYKSNRQISDTADGFIGKLNEYISLQSASVARRDEGSQSRAAESGKDLSYKLNDLFQTLDQESMLARDELTFANARQGRIFAQSGSANSNLLANSELVALGMMVTGETNRLFAVDSVAELDKLDSEIRSLFVKINERVRTMENSLTGLNAVAELRNLRAVAASLAAVRNRIYAADGIMGTLKKKLHAVQQADTSAEKLHTIVVKQTEKGNENVAIAREEQEKSIASVNSMAGRSLSWITGIGAVAICIAVFFGFWIYRSVMLPLRVVLAAVYRQREQGREKALLAEAVAEGDLTREVAVSEVMPIDQALFSKDEMGMVLQAVVEMGETQVTLDKAFAEMTLSLRRSRNEDARRDRLKNGLHEFDKILRGEQKIDEMADRALSFMIGFLDAGVGIIYLYDENEEVLQPLATYAVSNPERLGNGFRLGEGLAGQVALERRMIRLDTVPPDYLPIASALGQANPLHVALLPIMHDGTLAGVLELGSFRMIGDGDLEFLAQLLEGIAIAFNTHRSRQLVYDLLEQTQSQAEELRAQQEELQQVNEELAERARIQTEQRNIPLTNNSTTT